MKKSSPSPIHPTRSRNRNSRGHFVDCSLCARNSFGIFPTLESFVRLSTDCYLKSDFRTLPSTLRSDTLSPLGALIRRGRRSCASVATPLHPYRERKSVFPTYDAILLIGAIRLSLAAQFEPPTDKLAKTWPVSANRLNSATSSDFSSWKRNGSRWLGANRSRRLAMLCRAAAVTADCRERTRQHASTACRSHPQRSQ